MMLLAVDTALGACSVALLEGDVIRAHIFEPMERGHAERLAPMVDEAMKAADCRFLTARRASPSPPGRAPSPASGWGLPSCAACGLRCKFR